MKSTPFVTLCGLVAAATGCEWVLGADFSEVARRPAPAAGPDSAGGGSIDAGMSGAIDDGGDGGKRNGGSSGGGARSGAGGRGGGGGTRAGEDPGGGTGADGGNGADAGAGAGAVGAHVGGTGGGGVGGAGSGAAGSGAAGSGAAGASSGTAGEGATGEGGGPFSCSGEILPPEECPELACEEMACDQFLWRDGRIPYEFDPALPVFVRDAVVAAAERWMAASTAIQFVRCPDDACSFAGEERWLTVRPGGRAPWSPKGAGREILMLGTETRPSILTHELGHVIGLADAWQRPDRDRHLRMSWDYFCSSDSARALSRKCAAWPRSTPDRPDRTTGQFGPFDSRSQMNVAATYVCEKEGVEPDPNGAPTAWDGSAVTELYRTRQRWSPFRSLAVDDDVTEPLDEALSYGVHLAGSPGISAWLHSLLDAWARGDDGAIYAKNAYVRSNEFQYFGGWTKQGCCFDSDPAVFAWANANAATFARSEQEIFFSVIPDPALPAGNTEWTDWESIGRPDVGVGSAPAVASWGAGRLDVFVRGNDDFLYQKTFNNGWNAEWVRRGDRAFVGKPAAAARGVGGLVVVVNGGDGAAWQLQYNGSWQTQFESLGGSLYPGSSPAVATYGASRMDVFVRNNPDSRLYVRTLDETWEPWLELGGVLVGDPAARANTDDGPHVQVVAPVSVNGMRAVWWKYSPYEAPCTTNQSSGCASCTPASP